MTSTYHNDAAIEHTLAAILARLDQLAPAGSKDIGPADVLGPNGNGTSFTLPTYPPLTTWDDQQWMVPVSALLMKAVVKSAPGIVRDTVARNFDLFGTLGTLGGAIFGGSEGAGAGGHLGGMIDSVVTDVGDALLGGLSTIGSWFREAKDLPRGEADLQARFVFPFLTAVLPSLMQSVPTLVASLTKGYKDVPPTLTDADAVARWFGPLFQHLIPNLVDIVPDILSVISGPRP